MAGNDDFNSSDIEVPEPAQNPRFKRRGEQSIREIIEHAHEDRVASKVFEKSLTFGRGAPLTQTTQALWSNRFDAVRLHTFKQSLDKAPTGETLRRFVFAMAGRIKSNMPGKPAPNLRWLTDGYYHVVAYLRFKYSDFRLNAHDAERTASAFDQLVKEGRLHKGRWNKRAWIGYNLTLRLLSCFYADAINHGCINFDTIVSRALSMTLMAAAGNRCGDIAQVLGGFEKCFVSYSDVTLIVWEPDQDNSLMPSERPFEQVYANLVARVVIRFAKGHKDTEGDDFTFQLAPLNNTEDNLACPIANLLVMALRSGQTHGTTIEQVLKSTLARHDKTIQWRDPKLPLIPAISKSRRKLEFSTPATTGQLLQTVKRAGLLAGVTVGLKTHGFRRGHFQEVAHLGNDLGGAASYAVAQAGGHNHKSMTLGVTAEYAGGIDRHLYNDRAQSSYASPFAPKVVAESYIPAKLTSKEIDAYIEEHSYESKSKADRNNFARELRLRRQKEWMEQQSDNAAPLKNKLGPEGKPAEPLVVTILRRRTQSELNVNKARSTSESLKPASPITPDGRSSYIPIDPRLLCDGDDGDDGDDGNDDDAAELLSLMLGVPANEPNSGDEESDAVLTPEEERLSLQVAPLSESIEMLQSNSLIHINNLAAFNIVKVQKFARAWPNDTAAMALYSTSGNSRDNPSPFLYHCQKTEGCGFKYRVHDPVAKHELSCTPKAVADAEKRLSETPDEETFVCCDITIIGRRALKQHRKIHGWTPIPCRHGCRNGKPYEARNSYDRHMLSSHGDGTWVERHCPLFDADTETQGCGENTLFDAPGKLSYHLQRRHNLSSDAIQQYVNTRKRPVKSAEFVNSEDEEEDMDVQAPAKAIAKAPAKKRYKSRKLASFDEKGGL